MKLFTTKSCKQCPIVIGQLDFKGIEYEMIDAEENPELPAEYGFQSVPTIVKDDGSVFIGTTECLRAINE